MDFADIRNKSQKELEKLLAEQREELRNLRFKAFGGQLKQVHKIKQARKTIARLVARLAVPSEERGVEGTKESLTV